MKGRKYWGLAILIILLIGASVFMLMRNTDTEPIVVYDSDVEPSKVVMDSLRQSPMNPTDKNVGHSHADGSFHAEAHTADVNVSEEVVYPHQELLDTNPVLALKAQTEERGHWSARWIPLFPPDDQEAQTFARNRYLMTYYKSIGDIGNPICINAWREYESQGRAIVMETPTDSYSRGRRGDLMMITWTDMDQNDLHPLYVNGMRALRSNYFPLFLADLEE